MVYNSKSIQPPGTIYNLIGAKKKLNPPDFFPGGCSDRFIQVIKFVVDTENCSIVFVGWNLWKYFSIVEVPYALDMSLIYNK